jgi:8-amino-7-oxononanoate synthase
MACATNAQSDRRILELTHSKVTATSFNSLTTYSPNSEPYGWIDDSLAAIHKANWYRSTREISGRPGPTVQMQGKTLLNFCSNDYLGLAGDERLVQAAIAATQTYGTGATGSRLVSGHRDLHRQLELAIAALKQTEDALVFSSGYLANLGTLAALVSSRDLILADQYNHSSLKNGAILSGAATVDYRHCDLEDLQAKLQQHRASYRRCLIVTDSVFSMDGDLCPLPEILAIANQFDSMVMIDEAHATGVLGAKGAGSAEHFGCSGQPLVQIGTLSKALGSLGGYVAGSSQLIEFLRNRAASWIYTTGLSPADTAAALAAIAVLQQEPQRLERLWQNINALKQELESILQRRESTSIYKLLPSASAIFCLQLPDAATALAASNWLQKANIFATAIRPPTVPTSRLRLTVMATHKPVHLQVLVQALRQFTKN